VTPHEHPGAWAAAVAAHQQHAAQSRYRTRFRTARVPAGPSEAHYRDLLAAQTGGRTEVRLPFGIADVLTDTTIFEVAPVRTWRAGVRQALHYAAQVPQQGAPALYGDTRDLRKIWQELQHLPEPGLELWWLTGEIFIRIKKVKD
jgi:hypothetical protein